MEVDSSWVNGTSSALREQRWPGMMQSRTPGKSRGLSSDCVRCVSEIEYFQEGLRDVARVGMKPCLSWATVTQTA